MSDGLIDDPQQLPQALGVLAPCSVLAVDTEFLWERTYYPKLALLQVAGRDANGDVQAFAFDPLNLDPGPVVELLAEPERLKVFHAGRIDLQIVHRLLEEPLRPVFDTQCAAALAGYGPQIGYANLVQATLQLRLKKTEQYTDWTRRPLRDSQLAYALDDVVHLVDVYEMLCEQLETRGRLAWAKEEMANLVEAETFAEPPSAELYLKVKRKQILDRRGLAILRELARWRDEEARRRDLRPGFVAKDPVLIDIAGRRPNSIAKLRQTRGLHKSEIKRRGEAILACVRRGLACPDDALPELARKRRSRGRDLGATVDLLRAFLNRRAGEVGVAVETLATSSELERLARDGQRERFAKDHPVLQGWRREMAGEDLLRLLRGEMSVGVDPESAELRLVEGPGEGGGG